MPVPFQPTYAEHIANGVTVAFGYDFMVLQKGDLQVLLSDAIVDQALYSVAGLGSASGTVEFNLAPPDGVRVLIRLKVALTRATGYPVGGAFKSHVLNDDLDRLWLALQGRDGDIGSAVRLPFPEVPPPLPVAAERARKLVAFDENGLPYVMVPAADSSLELANMLAQGDGSTNVGFRQTAAGNIYRTMLAKMRETISITDFGAVGDGLGDQTAAIQAAINAAYGKTLMVPPGRYRCLGQLVINQPIKIVGSLRQLTGGSYAENLTTLWFPNLTSGQWALTIGGSAIIGLGIDGISLSGGLLGGGLRIAGTISQSISDAVYRNILIYNFAIGLQQTYSVCPLFENVRIQSCTNGVQNNSQTNNAKFQRCSFATLSDVALSHSNVEGMEYSSCNFANWTRSTFPMTMFQSEVVMTNPYFENIANLQMALVGGSSEATNSKSALLILAPFKMNNDIAIASGAYVDVIGGIRGTCKVYAVGTPVSVRRARTTDDSNITANSRTFIERCPAGRVPRWGAYSGGVLSYLPGRGYTRVSNSNAAATSGAIIASGTLVVGQVYTLKIAMRESAVALTNAMRLRNGSTITQIPIDAAGAAAIVRVYPFVAEATSLQLQFSGEVELFGYSIQAGNDQSGSEDIFSTAGSSMTPYEGDSPAIPLDGTWQQRDRLLHSAPAVGTPEGWVCVSGGAPGSWRPMNPNFS